MACSLKIFYDQARNRKGYRVLLNEDWNLLFCCSPNLQFWLKRQMSSSRKYFLIAGFSHIINYVLSACLTLHFLAVLLSSSRTELSLNLSQNMKRKSVCISCIYISCSGIGSLFNLPYSLTAFVFLLFLNQVSRRLPGNPL